MKTTFVPLLVAALSLIASADDPTWRPDAGFRGTFKHNDYTFALSLDYVKPKAPEKNQRIDCRMSLE